MLVAQSKKTENNTKISETEKKVSDHDHDKYIATPELNILATNTVNKKIKQANLVTKTNFDNKLLSLDSKISKNITKKKSIEKKL